MQESVSLTKVDIAKYTFDDVSLLYDFEFIVNAIRTHSNNLTANIDYIFDPTEKTITLIGSYQDYSGMLFGDITYKAFEWTPRHIATLEPVTLTFQGDYINNITKFMELVLQYDSIPGYEMEKIHRHSGRLVLSDEDKSSALLNIYLYNFVEDRWDEIPFVCYDDYTGTNTFSYVADRNFVLFEDYFNKTSSGEFEVKVIFAVEEDIGESFITKTGFSISSIGANLFYNTPHSEHFINPEIEFDIDLTDYYTNDEIYLEEISLELDYEGEIEFDDAFVYSQYALIEENYNFYLRNEYLDFEVFTLDNDGSITLSREELNRIIIHDPEIDRWYVRAKLEYDWNCILQMNLGSKSKLLVLHQLGQKIQKYPCRCGSNLSST